MTGLLLVFVGNTIWYWEGFQMCSHTNPFSFLLHLPRCNLFIRGIGSGKVWITNVILLIQFSFQLILNCLSILKFIFRGFIQRFCVHTCVFYSKHITHQVIFIQINRNDFLLYVQQMVCAKISKYGQRFKQTTIMNSINTWIKNSL